MSSTPTPSSVEILSSTTDGAAKAPATSPPSKKDFAVAEQVKKGEDRWCAVKDSDQAFYGLFDGHGGPLVASGLAQSLPSKILSTDSPDFVEAFYAVDRELGESIPRQGSTATAAHVARRSPRSVRVTLAWVGDSKAIGINMLGRSLVWQSTLHHVTSKEEQSRIMLQWKLRDQGRRARNEKEMDDLVSRLVEEDNHRKAVAAAGGAFSSTFKRASDRSPAFDSSQHSSVSSTSDSVEGDEILESTRRLASRGGVETIQASFATTRDMLERALSYESRVERVAAALGNLRRSQSFVGHRAGIDGRAVGPMVLQSVWHQPDEEETKDAKLNASSETACLKGASTCVTRAVGDYDSSRTLIPHPDVAIHDMEIDEAKAESEAAIWRRYVLASDGLWDVVKSSKAFKIASNAATPTEAANALLAHAKRQYVRKVDKRHAIPANPFRDDTTVLVFDVRLGDPAAKPIAKQSSFPSFSSLRGGGSSKTGEFGGLGRGAAKKSQSTSALLRRSSKFKLVSMAPKSLGAIPVTTMEEVKQEKEDGDDCAPTENCSTTLPAKKKSIVNFFGIGSNTAAAAAAAT